MAACGSAYSGRTIRQTIADFGFAGKAVAALAMALWAVGFVVETVADRQLRRFAADPANAAEVLDRGPWRFARHPNYFGECCVWWGFWCFALSAGAWWSLPGPVLVTWMLWASARASEKGSGNSRPRYADYVRKTRAFFPGIPRKSGT